MNLSDNIFVQLFLSFMAGVGVSFTPCVYPLIPMTASIIASVNTKGSKLGGFFVSCIYVLGMAISYCALALFAVLSGQFFGFWQNNAILFLVIGNLMLFFALVLFDVIHLPFLGVSFQQNIKVRNLWSIFLLGGASGAIVGPCTAPVLGSLLAYVASKKNLVLGTSLLFVFSYGVGASLILVGTFSNLLGNLPKSGRWLVWIKRLCAFVLIVTAEYFFIKAGRLME